MKAVKGQIVYLAGSWNHFNIGSVRELRVHSWGKKVAKFYDLYPGGEVLIKDQFYLKDGENSGFYATREEAEAAAHAIAANHVETRIARVRQELEDGIKHGWIRANNRHKALLAGYERDGVIVLDYRLLLALISAYPSEV